MFMASDNQADAARRIISRYCREIRGKRHRPGADSVALPPQKVRHRREHSLNEAIREVVNPFRSAEDEIKIGVKVFRVNDRIMQTKNTAKVSNGDRVLSVGIKKTVRTESVWASILELVENWNTA